VLIFSSFKLYNLIIFSPIKTRTNTQGANATHSQKEMDKPEIYNNNVYFILLKNTNVIS